ncbi:ClC family H(+)/Cl(-) exchange transporter [Anaerovorax sp. IOR16]|uniref:ClC family H(+)/Cl(-) exchange transporter n=1 Tax=Anaerovorax sp. IOR16 TaxID=2773458 RepID=UPI0019D0DBBD|nr:ClC family H(+)/Cl(-) exchange transporter [Anaerovorax sp. IOR16]
MKNNYKALFNTDRHMLFLIGKSLLIGILVGVAVVAYRWILATFEALSIQMYDFLSTHSIGAFLLFPALILAGYGIGLLIKKYPLIGGSGIPQVKGIMLGHLKNAWVSTLFAKFFGGAICILAGLSLGREGPSIQLGACVADGIAQKYGKTRMERKFLMASGASAGLAAAFNAPLAGVMFTLEEIFKYFSPSILLSTMTAAVTSDFVSKNVFGLQPVFHFPIEKSMPLSSYWILILLGIVLGIAGAFYNWFLLETQKWYKKIDLLPAASRPAIAFIIAGFFGLFFPIVLGGGHKIVPQLTPESGIVFLLMLLVLKFIFSMISFGCGAPGGIFFPLLIMGACIGAIFGNVAVNFLGFSDIFFYNFIILAMAGYFTAIVRAPITGVVLIVEMTGSFSHMLALTVVSLVAYVVADLLKSRPIYDSLLKNLLKSHSLSPYEEDNSVKITMEFIVQFHSTADGSQVRDITWPSGCLLIAVKREGSEIIPKGHTKILAGDYLVCLAPINEETKIRTHLLRLTESSEHSI